MQIWAGVARLVQREDSLETEEGGGKMMYRWTRACTCSTPLHEANKSFFPFVVWQADE